MVGGMEGRTVGCGRCVYRWVPWSDIDVQLLIPAIGMRVFWHCPIKPETADGSQAMTRYPQSEY